MEATQARELVPRREVVIESGEALSRIVINRGQRCIGSVAVVSMPLDGLPPSALIVGGYGYLGLWDVVKKKLFDFQYGSVSCRDGLNRAFPEAILEMEGIERHVVPNTRFFGKGDDSEVIKILEEYRVVEAVESAIEGRCTPQAFLMVEGLTDGEWDRRKWGLEAWKDLESQGEGPVSLECQLRIPLMVEALTMGRIFREGGFPVARILDWSSCVERARDLGDLPPSKAVGLSELTSPELEEEPS